MAHNVSHRSLRHKMVQVSILVFVIIGGMLFSKPANAQHHNLIGISHTIIRLPFKSNSSKACYLLYKKRTSTQNRTVVASSRVRRLKYKPMAETDQPMRVASLN